jgi:hypothetical protein
MEREFIILPTFDRKWKELGLDDEDLRNLENEILQNPDKHPVIQGTGGIRKIRISLPGRGKRSGGRALYIDFVVHKTIFFLAVYAKNQKEDLSPEEKKTLKSLVELLKEQF